MKKISLDEIIERLPTLADALRSSGIKVGTGQLVESARILQSYVMLRGDDLLDIDEVKFVLSSTLALNQAEDRLLNEILESIIYTRSREESTRSLLDEIKSSLEVLNLRPGDKVRKRTIFSKGRNKKEKIATYLKLKGAGVIRGSPGDERVVSWQKIVEISRLLAKKGFSSLDEYLKSSNTLDSEDLALRADSGVDVKNRELLEKVDNKRLIRLGKIAMRKRDRRLLSVIAEEVSKRILNGSLSGSTSAMKILEKAGLSTSVHVKKMALRDPDVVVKSNMNVDEKLDIIKSLPEEKAAEALAKLVRDLKDLESIDKILSSVDPTLLWAVKRNPYEGKRAQLLSAAVEAARGLRESLLYAETGEPGRAEMATYLAERSLEKCRTLNDVNIGNINVNTIRALATLALNIVGVLEAKGEVEDVLDNVLMKLPVVQGITLLRGLYRRADPLTKRYIVQTATNYLYRFSSKEGLRLLPRKIKDFSGPGRVYVKDTTFRMVRSLDDPLVYIKKLKTRSVSLALDLSGSMLEYSMWAISIAMLFAKNIEKLTLFSHSVKSLNGPFTRSELAELLLSLEFKGYTDVYNAIIEACNSKSRKVIFVSDIKQTVESGDPVVAVREYCKRNSLVFIAPPSYDSELGHRLELNGAKVVVAFKPQDVAREVLRYLIR